MTLDTLAFRQIVGQFATGVTIVTTAHEGWLHGITVNAFTSVSLDPMLLLICIDKEAHAHEQLERAGRFAINILAEEQADLSTLFATKAPPEQGRLRGAPFHESPAGLPLFDGSIAYLECDVTELMPGGDHTIFMGKVLGGEIVREAPPLLFYGGAYGRLIR